MNMTWLSGMFRLSSPINMATANVESSGTVTFELLADGSVKYGPVAVSSYAPFWLPADYRSMRYQVRLAGTGTVRAFALADTKPELLSDGRNNNA